MSGDHAKREIMTGKKPECSGSKNDERTPSKEADDKHKEESASSIKSHRKGDKKKKKMKKVVYYETDSFITKSTRSIVRCLYAILTFQNALLYFPYP